MEANGGKHKEPLDVRSGRASRQLKDREESVLPEMAHRPGLGPAHAALLRGGQVVMAGEMQPAVDDVEGELRREPARSARSRTGLADRGVGRHADLPGHSGLVVPGVVESDDIRCGRIAQKPRMEPGERRVREEDNGEIAGTRKGGPGSGQRGGGPVKGTHGAEQRAAVDAQSGMEIGNGDAALAQFPFLDLSGFGSVWGDSPS